MTLTGDIISKPYINLTLQLMKDFGAEAEWLYDNCIEVRPKPYTSVPFMVESDWSAASYWYQMAALAPEAEIQLNGLFADSYQGDSKVTELFTELGVETIFNSKGALLRKTGVCCEQMEYNFINEPDLTQTFAVTCAVMGIPFRFSGLHTLKIKETDRITALS